MRRIIVLVLILTITLSSSLSYSLQIRNCSIQILNSNGLREIYPAVTLTSFKDDILSFRAQDSLYSVSIKEIISLEYPGKSTSSKGLIIGASVGIVLGVTAAFIVRGISSHGSSKRNLSVGAVVLGEYFLRQSAVLSAVRYRELSMKGIKLTFPVCPLKM